jgi:hypothetical protein
VVIVYIVCFRIQILKKLNTYQILIIKDLNLIEFDWKDGSGHEDIGFSAQQAGSVSSDLRGEDADGYSTVHEGRLIRYLVGAVQQLQKELEELKNGTKLSDDERE